MYAISQPEARPIVLQEMSRDEVRRIVKREAGRNLSIKQFYEWLPYCLIPEPKDFYSVRDIKKFLFVARILNRVRNLNSARQKLIETIQTTPEFFDYDIY